MAPGTGIVGNVGSAGLSRPGVGRYIPSLLGVVFALALAVPASAQTPQDCRTKSPVQRSGTFNLRADNDLFGGIGQDQGYTNGFLLSWVSTNLVDYLDDPCLPPIVVALNRHLAWLQPDGFDEQNMTIGFGQTMYTPNDRVPTALITNDRPYAGALMVGIGYNARKGDVLRTSLIRFGVVGPSAYAKQVQSRWHDIIGVDRFNGWDNQLRDEPVLQLVHERRTRVARGQASDAWGWDLTRHWGVSLGNFATYANVGGELRFGLRLPDDFGTLPLRPAGENTSPVKEVVDANWSGHAFVGIDARWVLYDITLDGNTYKSSHSVDKRALVADLGYGVAMYAGPWRIALSRYRRTREFVGQEAVPVYGTITVGRRF